MFNVITEKYTKMFNDIDAVAADIQELKSQKVIFELRYRNIKININNITYIFIREEIENKVEFIESIARNYNYPKCKTCKYDRIDCENKEYCFLTDELIIYSEYEVCCKYDEK